MLPVAPHVEHAIPPYDMDAFLIEAELLLEWYLPRLGIVVTDDARADFYGHWRDALKPLLDAPLTWTLRDFHSPNLLWLPGRTEIARLGVLDFQDAETAKQVRSIAHQFREAAARAPVLFDNVRLFDADKGVFIDNQAVLSVDGKVKDQRVRHFGADPASGSPGTGTPPPGAAPRSPAPEVGSCVWPL